MRTILEALILAALIWCGRTLIDAGKQIAVITSQLDAMTTQMRGMPELGTRVTKLEIMVDQQSAEIQELRRLRNIR